MKIAPFLLAVGLPPAAAIAQPAPPPIAAPMGTGPTPRAMGALGGGPMGAIVPGPMGRYGLSGPMGGGLEGPGGPMGATPQPGFDAGTGRSTVTLGGTSSVGTGRATRGDPSGASRIRGNIGTSIGTTVNTQPSRTVEGDAPLN